LGGSITGLATHNQLAERLVSSKITEEETLLKQLEWGKGISKEWAIILLQFVKELFEDYYENGSVPTIQSKSKSKVIQTSLTELAQDHSISVDKARKLYEQLKKKRLELAHAGNCPAYVIFNNATIIDLIPKSPKDRNDLLRVCGFGPKRANAYGDALYGSARTRCGLKE